MKDKESNEELLTENEFFNATGLDEKTREMYERAGYLKPAKTLHGVKYYSEDAVEITKAMTFCFGRCANLQEAYQMALEGIASKRSSQEPNSCQLVMVDPRNIRPHPRFEGLLRINEDLEESLTVDMAVGIYYASQPVVLGTWPGQEEPVLIDGHTRRKAAIAAGIKEIPAFLERFYDENGALKYVAKVQTQRRPTDDWVRYQLIVELDSLMERGGDRRSEQAKSKGSQGPIETKYANSAERTAALTATSPTTVKRARRIHRDGWPSLLEAMKKGEMTITQAEKAIAEKACAKAEKETEEESQVEKKESLLDRLTDANRSDLKEVGGDLYVHVNRALKGYFSYLRKNNLFPEKK